ncbi:hypothetical protein NRK67_02035 [Fusobacteria bacterium ZRK30]|nr:hypothetical protein NRK67_02035 [Fusobacteria bacterium ZRK30]
MVGLSIRSAWRINKYPKKSSVSPGIIAALGIIGTFFGIFIGLMKFDSNELEASVPNLINGMRTAFFTSLLGLTFSNILKGWKAHKINQLSKNENKEEDVSLERIAELMNIIKSSVIQSNEELVNNIKEMNKGQEITQMKNQESMDRMVKALVGDSETSMTTQMKLMRTDLVDSQREAQTLLNSGLDKMVTQLGNLVESNNAISKEIEKGNEELITEFRSFAKDMAENNMKAFIDAIEKSIKDLNTQLKEQFGENFKQLNIAVEKLLEWQVHYKETIEQTNSTQIELYEGMSQARNLVSEIMENTKPIIEVANRLGDKIVTFDTQEQKLNSSIETLNKVSEHADILLPNLDNYIKNYHEGSQITLNNIEENLNVVYKNIEGYIKSSDDKIRENSIQATNRITDHVVETTKKGIEEVNRSSNTVLNAVATIHEKATNEITGLSGLIDNKVEKMIEIVSKTSNNLFENTDKLLTNITSTTNKIEAQILENANNLDQSRNEILKLTKVATTNITEQQKQIMNAINDITQGIKNTSNLNLQAIEKQIEVMEKAVTKLENEGFTITKKISDNIQVMVENNNKNLETSVNNLNSQLGVSLNTSLESLGNQLASVSEKFVTDYTPLTRELQKVVEIAKRVG